MSFLPQTSHQKKLAFGLILVLLYLALEGLVGSIYNKETDPNLRAFEWDSKTLWKLRPNFRGPTYGHNVRINAAGFRGTDEYMLEPNHAVRIIAIGDSRTYGFEVPDESTFCHVLQTELRGKGVDAEVINAGTHGYSAVQCRAKLEQLLAYKPRVVVFSAGYNDRRYLLLTPPDSEASFRRIAFLRKCVEALQWSNILHAVSTELGIRKLRSLLDNPPPLDRVPIRVPPEVFRDELRQVVNICREKSIQLVFLMIEQNPSVFEPVERAARRLEEKQTAVALELLEKAEPELHVAALAFCHYLRGTGYRALGDESKAREYYEAHKPLGSLHGEAVLHREEPYLDIYRETAREYEVPLVDSREAIGRINDYVNEPGIDAFLDQAEENGWKLIDDSEAIPRQDGRVTDLENFFRARFMDECHLDPVGHILIGKALARVIGERM
ncbi:MAG: SGNH/GDSL hydrolase family protein [bacterium]